MVRLVSYLLIFLIRIYQKVISPILMPACRYTPSCSEYGIQAITKYGPLKGSWLACKRILSCNPWGGSGHRPLE